MMMITFNEPIYVEIQLHNSITKNTVLTDTLYPYMEHIYIPFTSHINILLPRQFSTGRTTCTNTDAIVLHKPTYCHIENNIQNTLL
jgi:hypothetical protein